MRISAALAVLAGGGLATYLFAATGPAAVMGLLFDAGYGVAVVIAFHFFQILFDALAWRVLLGAAVRPPLGMFMVLRWIREATNNLLPVAQIGGEVVGARLLSLFGVGVPEAAASTAIDLTSEMLSQVAFTVFGIAVLLSFEPRSAPLWQAATYALIGLLALGFGFVAAQWAGIFRVVEQGLLRIGRRLGWRSVEQVVGLHRAIVDFWRTPKAVLACGALHLVSWLLGGVEVMLACHYLGHDISLWQGIVLESLSQAMKSAGFAIPGGLGVQEGGLLLLAPLFGLPAEDALALSLLRRLREMVLGVPALIAWHPIAARAGIRNSAVQAIARRP